MAVKKNRKSKCIFFDFLGENLEIAPKQGKNGVEVVKVITFIRGVYEINNFRDPQLHYVRCKKRCSDDDDDNGSGAESEGSKNSIISNMMYVITIIDKVVASKKSTN